jgi:hypothetical protein
VAHVDINFIVILTETLLKFRAGKLAKPAFAETVSCRRSRNTFLRFIGSWSAVQTLKEARLQTPGQELFQEDQFNVFLLKIYLYTVFAWLK